LERYASIALIGLDWGSTNLRAYAFDSSGNLVAHAQSSAGAMTLLSSAAFDGALHELVGAWLAASPRAGLIACGMVGARGAWVEAGYCEKGAGARELHCAMKSITTASGHTLRVVPGIASNALDEVDVMRGEETQIIGAPLRDGVIVLPGTHSKWARIEDGRITAFETYVTGEMNALIRQQSSIGKVFVDLPSISDAAAVDRGIARAKRSNAHWLHELFGFRARVVSGTCESQQVSTEFSAWLIASEFAQATRVFNGMRAIRLIASETLQAWYTRIAPAFDVECTVLNIEKCVTRGLWQIARADK
jgi:2-dehydro-3-deoxygalactonokinase